MATANIAEGLPARRDQDGPISVGSEYGSIDWLSAFVRGATCQFGNKTLMAVFGYFDASGSKSDAAISCAGFISSDDEWKVIVDKWNYTLSVFNVPALHMKDFIGSKRAFVGWNKDEEKRRAFMGELTGILNANARASISCSLGMEGYRRTNQVFQVEESMGTPYAFVADAALYFADDWYQQHGQKEPFHCFVEKGDEDQNDLRRLRDEQGNPPYRFLSKKCSRDRPDAKCIVPFQCADLLAYESFKALKTLGVVGKPGAYGEWIVESEHRRKPHVILMSGDRYQVNWWASGYQLMMLAQIKNVPGRISA